MMHYMISYVKAWFHNFFQAYIHLTIFFPYFFSVTKLVSTLFTPWKKLTVTHKRIGFSFSDSLSDISIDLVSRSIGFCMRMSLLIFYFMLQTSFILLLPVFLAASVLLLPLFFVFHLRDESDSSKKERKKTFFTDNHLLDEKNRAVVEQWFEVVYHQTAQKEKWWALSQLFAIPPLARDWSSGFTPILDQYTVDLTSSTYQIRTKNMLDRVKEIAQMERILIRAEKANVLIVGDDGVGKHTVVEALAKKMYEGLVNQLLMYNRILKLNMERILAQHTDQKMREEFFNELIKEAESADNIILLLDNADRYLASQDREVNLFASIEKFINSPHIHFIAITTPFAYQKYLYPNQKLIESFEKLDVFEISKEEAQSVLLSHALNFEIRYQVTIPYETIHTVVEKSEYFITYIPFPEKAIQLLDDICIYTVQQLKKTVVLPETVDIVLGEKLHTPTTVNNNLKEKLLHLEKYLTTEILQQTDAVKEVSAVLRRSYLLMGKRKKPLASFLFIGPTGVGKTQLAQTLQRILYPSEQHFLRFDMSEYQSVNDIDKLIGSAYSHEPGLLTSQIRQTPSGILLLDEIEKANTDLLNIFLSILDEGYFIDGYGHHVDCKNLIIIATSNAGSEIIYRNGLQNDHLLDTLIEHHYFTPEFLNRFDGIIPFRMLESSDLLIIAKQLTAQIVQDLYRAHEIRINVSSQFIEEAVLAIPETRFGVRSLERVLRSRLEDDLAKKILSGELKPGDALTV